jgi:hypothetical protein
MIGVPKPYPSTKKIDFFVCLHLNLMIFLYVNITLQGINKLKKQIPLAKDISNIYIYIYPPNIGCNPSLWR